MKKLVILLVSALVVAGTAVSLAIWHKKKSERAAIQQVINERTIAREVFNNANIFYTVKAGDTLPGIANHFGVSVGTLLSANNLPNDVKGLKGHGIKVGQKLINPAAFAFANYVAELGKINPASCPKPFRDAWLNYVESWVLKNDPIIQKQNQLDETPTKKEGHFGLSMTGGQIGSDVEAPNLHSAAERLEKLDNAEAWLKCKRVALDYGVFVQ